LQTADGALNETSSMLQRMRELAVLSVNDTYSTTQKTAMATEFNQLSSEIDRISTQTQWNGMAILNGSGGLYSGNASSGQFTFQVGANGTTSGTNTNVFSVTIGKSTTEAAVGSGPVGIFNAIIDSKIYDSVTPVSATSAKDAITAIDTSIKNANEQRGAIGAAINRLNYAADNLSNISTNTAASRSRIEDTDYATASTELARTQIIQQAATAMLAQANQSPQSVLALLK
jgi:flagellin